MIRDEWGIIVQPKFEYDFSKPYDEQPDKVDEGDSAFSTGLSAFGGSETDFQLMPVFIKDGRLVRHPYSTQNTGAAPHNDPDATSRDQVLAFFAGLDGRATEPSHREVRAACLNYAKSWRVNKDFFSFANKLYLFKVAEYRAPLWLSILGHVWQAGETLVNVDINPKHEKTQATAQAKILWRGWLWALWKFHPDLFYNLTEYFGGWRKRWPIADGMIAKVRRELNLK